MNQLILLITSFFYGLITGSIYNLILKKLLKTENMHIAFNAIFFIIITLIYIKVFYFLNNGDIHLYLKIVLIIGFILSFKMSNLSKRLRKFPLKELIQKIR